MTSSLKITVFFVLAMTISCYGENATNSNVTAEEIDSCLKLTGCSECYNLSGCIYTLKDCSAGPGNHTEADYVCIHEQHPNVTTPAPESNNCTLKKEECASLDPAKPAGPDNGTATPTLSPDPTQIVPVETTPAAESTTGGQEIHSGTTPISTEGDSTTTTGAAVTSAETSSSEPNTTTAGPPEPTNATGEATTDAPTTAAPTTATPTTEKASTTPEGQHSSTDGHPSTSDHTDPAKPASSRHFDAPSFIGGIILSVGLLAIAFVGYKFYRARTEHNYHTL